MRRVVITGMGIYSCIGTSLDEVGNSLRQGKSGIVFDPNRKDFGYACALTGMVPKPNLKKELSRRQRITLGRESEYSYIAAKQSFEQANINQDFIDKNEVGILFGNDSTAQSVMEAIDKIRDKKDTALVGSGGVFKSMNSTVTMNLATIFRLTGANFTVSAACSSGSHAIGMAYLLIKEGLQDYVLCGGAQEINKYAMASFDGLGVFSSRENDPKKASRPFDKTRDGLVPSGGAAALFLETYESAVARGATILGEIIGYGFSSNGEHISTPNQAGPAKAMNRAIQMSGLKASEIDYVNAHATSTPIGDTNEAKAITEVFKKHKPHVSSTKSMTGHECWMAGASEVVYSTIMMNNGFIAPNINLKEPDEDSAKLNIVKETLNRNFDVFLSNSFGFGGTNSALIVKKAK